MPRNALAHETSPYLLQHADNPVDWRPWGPQALEEARASGKPILLSVGYAACHWCHVMAHESFENEEIAALMNDLFVSIKVDREERPDIDAIYQHALALLGQHGGWPLTMFLTPDGHPFWGGTYFPPESRWGRPGFPEVLRAIAQFYRENPEKVGDSVRAIQDALENIFTPESGRALPLDINDQAARLIAREFDMVHGGIGNAPKFPNPSALALVWRAYRRTGDAALAEPVLLTLRKMCQGGVYDHLGGGFARYSTDRYWLAPHFEKMLYDNAQLIELLLWAWRDTGDPLFRQRIMETAEWVRREMVAEGGGFAATLDADSEGVEGKYYVWSAAEIDELLGPDAELFKRAYDVTEEGNWEHANILNRNHETGPFSEAAEAALVRCRDRLLEAREKRVRPGWDDKVLADWNGLMIAALAESGASLDRPQDLDAARTAFRFVSEQMWLDGRLTHSHRAGQSRHSATLDDYACMARAALALFEATGEQLYFDFATKWLGVLDAHYWDDETGGYYFTADDAEGLILRTRAATDNATPAGNAVICDVLARLYHLTGEDRYRARAEALIQAFAGAVRKNPFGHAALLNASEMLQRTVQIVIVGEPEDPGTKTLRDTAWASRNPNRLVLLRAPDTELPESHPGHGKTAVDGQATAYVCAGQTCSLPITEAEALAAAI